MASRLAILPFQYSNGFDDLDWAFDLQLAILTMTGTSRTRVFWAALALIGWSGAGFGSANAHATVHAQTAAHASQTDQQRRGRNLTESHRQRMRRPGHDMAPIPPGMRPFGGRQMPGHLGRPVLPHERDRARRHDMMPKRGRALILPTQPRSPLHPENLLRSSRGAGDIRHARPDGRSRAPSMRERWSSARRPMFESRRVVSRLMAPIRRLRATERSEEPILEGEFRNPLPSVRDRLHVPSARRVSESRPTRRGHLNFDELSLSPTQARWLRDRMTVELQSASGPAM